MSEAPHAPEGRRPATPPALRLLRTPETADARPLERVGLRDRVAALVLDMLLADRLQPGARLPIADMAFALDVSPTPVREALVDLEGSGLIERERRGYRVADSLTEREVHELFDARRMLEVRAIHLLEPGDPTLLGAMRSQIALATTLADELARGDVDGAEAMRRWRATERAFHDALIDASTNRYLRGFQLRLWGAEHRQHRVGDLAPRTAIALIAEHAAIADAVAMADRAALEAASAAHLRTLRDEALQALARA